MSVVVRLFTIYLLAPLLRWWSQFLTIISPAKFAVPSSPERLLKYLFGDKHLEILEFLTDVYFRFGLFQYEDKIYVIDPKISMKIINKLDKGAHDYLKNSPLNSTFLGSSNRSPETRHVIAAMFRKTNMEAKGRAMVDVIKKTIDKLKSLKTVNLSEILLKMALDIVGKVLLHVDLGALEDKQEQLLSAMMTILHRTYALGDVKPGSPEFQSACEIVESETRKILKFALDNSGSEDKSLGQLLHETGGFDQAVDNLKLFLMAGSETTASSLPVFLHLLAQRPDLQQQLQEEADEFITRVTEDGSCTPPQLESSLKELLRTYAIAPYISRRTHEKLDVEGITLPADSDLRIFTWGIHRSPSLWTQAKDFTPTRFLEADPSHQHHPQNWFPFGAGSRICIGQHLAWVEMRLALTYFLHSFNFREVQQTAQLEFCVDWEHAVVHPVEDVVLGVTCR